MKKGKLSPKRKKFIQEFVKNPNATQAAIKAGYSKKTADRQGSRLLSNAEIAPVVEESIKKAEEEAQVSIVDTLKKIANLANSDLRNLFNEDGSLKQPKDWPDNIALAVSSIEVDELFEGTGKDREQIGFTKKVKLWDKTKSLEMLGRYLKMFTDKVENSLSPELFDLLEKAHERGKNIAGHFLQ